MKVECYVTALNTNFNICFWIILLVILIWKLVHKTLMVTNICRFPLACVIARRNVSGSKDHPVDFQ